jgi:hypothetical protein
MSISDKIEISKDVKSKLSHDETEKIVYSKLKKNASRWFTKIGSGSARDVYDINGKYVVKVAKNPKGIAQNEQECDTHEIEEYKDFLANILYCASDYSFVVMEHAEKVKNNKVFRDIMGFGIDYLHHEFQNRFGKKWYNHTYDKKRDIPKDEDAEITIREISDYVGNVIDEGYGDIVRLSSWGIVERNGNKMCVLVDYGLNNEIYNELYVKPRMEKMKKWAW